jgi:hypothetical protein
MASGFDALADDMERWEFVRGERISAVMDEGADDGVCGVGDGFDGWMHSPNLS